jgi:GntR family transcriptional repressor for pyruvate dehydrogenase complex
MFELRAVDKDKLFTSIVDQIVEGVRLGAFSPGQALPAERLLANQLNVSRSSVREAIRVLEHAGIVDVRSGSGTFVTEEALSKTAMQRAKAELIGEHSPLDVVVARRTLEPQCAGLAALQRHERDLTVLRARVKEHQRLYERGENAEEADLSFHLAVAGACHNPVLEVLVQRLVEVMHQSTWREMKLASRGRPGVAQTYLDQHRGILTAIEDLDQDKARKRMQQHLDSVEEGLLAQLP